MLRPRVSVALCTYNGAQFLAEQLSSIYSQTIKPDELVISDDASTDNTLEIIEDFMASKAIPVRLLTHKKNSGFTSNFQSAILECNGSVIFLSDQDDIWYPDKIEVCLNLLDTHPDILGLTHEARLVNHNGDPLGTFLRAQILRGYGPSDSTITGCVSCFRQDIRELLFPVPLNIVGHDTWISYVFTFFASRWIFLDVCLQDIRRHFSNASEWIVNTSRPITSLDVMLWQLRSPPASSYSNRIAINNALRSRLSMSPITIQYLNLSELQSAKCLLDQEHGALLRRDRIVNTINPLSRFIFSLIFLFHGNYKFFNGYKSFLRDVLRL